MFAKLLEESIALSLRKGGKRKELQHFGVCGHNTGRTHSVSDCPLSRAAPFCL